jgi:hypothetical protein
VSKRGGGLIGAVLALWMGCALFTAATAETADIAQVYLVQNSGWMEPFYADRKSQFRTVVSLLVEKTQLPGGRALIATFNQNGQIPGHSSPERIFSGTYDRAAAEQAIAQISPPHRPDGKYADSDFYGAMMGAISGLLGGRQGIIWMVTNNKASPNNSAEVLANTKKFYDGLRGADAIARIIAFPIRMPVHGPNYDERGFIIYGIAYGDVAARSLDALVAAGQPIRQVFKAPPVRLKPLDQDPMKLELTAQSDSGMTATLENGALVIRHIPARGASFSLNGSLTNSYYPQQIASARLETVATPVKGVIPFVAALTPAEVQDLAPGGTIKDIRLNLKFNPIVRPTIFRDHEQVEGSLLIKLNDANLTLGGAFVAQMKDVFGIDMLVHEQRSLQTNGLPNVFFDYRQVNAATTVVPVVLVYDFSPWPAILAFGVGGLVLVLLGGGAFLLAKPRTYTVHIGGSRVQVRLKPFEQRVVQNTVGQRAGVRGSLFGAPTVALVEDKNA